MGHDQQSNQLGMKAQQNAISNLKAERAELCRQLSESRSDCRVVRESLRCEKAAHEEKRAIVHRQWQTCKAMNALIASSSSSRSPTCCVEESDNLKDLRS